ncbi:MAG: hypothetical protein U0794_06595 [Isosphaeraceae bacterium]
MAHLTLDDGYGVPTLLVVAVVAFGLAALGYRRSYGDLPATAWWRLLWLRWASIGLIMLLLFQPVLRFESEVREGRGLVLALDASASMATADDATGVSRFDQARRRLLDWSGKLARDFDVRWLVFSDRAGTVDRPADLAAIQPDGRHLAHPRSRLPRVPFRRARRSRPSSSSVTACTTPPATRSPRPARGGSPSIRSAWATAFEIARATATCGWRAWSVRISFL